MTLSYLGSRPLPFFAPSGFARAALCFEQRSGYCVAGSGSRSILQKQGMHHPRMNFEAELVALLKKHGIEFDPRFVFG